MEAYDSATDNKPIVGYFTSFSQPLRWMVGDATSLGFIWVNENGERKLIIAPVEANELDQLISQHLEGKLASRTFTSDNGTPYTVTNIVGLTAPMMWNSDGTSHTTRLVFDVDGSNHVDGNTDEKVARLTRDLAAVCGEGGLYPNVARSNSAQGRHVIIVLPQEEPPAFIRFIAERARELVDGADKVEIFPASDGLRDDKVGKTVALPMSGKPPAPGGGRFIDDAGNDVGIEAIQLADVASLDAMRPLWQRARAARERIRIAHAALAALRNRSRMPGSKGDDDWSDVGLEAVVRRFAEIADDRETEAHIIGIRCPTHGGTCLHVCPEQGWYFCHRCGHTGAGPPAPFFLLRLLRPDLPPNKIREELQALRINPDSTTSAPGGTP
jgi:hypothetical protein